MWRERCNNIKVRKVMRFSVCAVCDKWRVAMYNAKAMSLRKTLADEQRVHLADVRLERQAYWRKRQAARDDPSSCLSLIIDGADQAKYKFPSAWSKVTPFPSPLRPIPLPCSFPPSPLPLHCYSFF